MKMFDPKVSTMSGIVRGWSSSSRNASSRPQNARRFRGSVFIPVFGSADPIDGGGESSDLVRREGALDEHVPVALERRT
jgi:hypothetical protein